MKPVPSKVIHLPALERKPIIYPDQELELFLDSIAHLSSSVLAKQVALFADSVFMNQKWTNANLSEQDFQTLKRAIRENRISVGNASRIFKDDFDSSCNTKSISLTYANGTIPVIYYSFNKEGLDEYALCIGDPEHCYNASLYFFKKNKIIAKHDGYSRYGLSLKHYKDIDGNTIVYYVHEFTDGSGVWWNNYFFYKYNGDRLMPVLDELQNGNLQSPSPWGFRTFWLESFIEKTNPLTIKMVYYGQLPDTTKADPGTRIIDDSTVVRYSWNEQSKKLEGQYQDSKITRSQLLSYYGGDNDLLFMNGYYKVLKDALHNKTTRKSTLDYLNQVKNYYSQNNQDIQNH